jgi:TPP-dependent pyruvate/acetoin dehydrogenase alpha subunit
LSRATKNTNIASRAAAYGIPGVQVDGNNVLEVYWRAGEAIESARQGRGPTLLECLTYRWFGHHEGDPGVAYRPKEEIAAWKERDPIMKLREDAIANNWARAEDFDVIHAEVKTVLEEAARFALDSPLEDVSTALEHVFSN